MLVKGATVVAVSNNNPTKLEFQTLKPEQNGCHFSQHIFICYNLLAENNLNLISNQGHNFMFCQNYSKCYELNLSVVPNMNASLVPIKHGWEK